MSSGHGGHAAILVLTRALGSAGPALGLAPKGKWLVMVSTRLEGEIDGEALAVAKRELAAVRPLSPLHPPSVLALLKT